MNLTVRKAFPYVAGFLTLAALAWALSFDNLEDAEFTFNNGTELQTIDPPKATGSPEGRIINALFEGLFRNHPVGIKIDEAGNVVGWPEPGEDGNVAMKPVPAIAQSCDISEDGKTYTFKIRRGAQWSDGSPITAEDFRWSWMRMLHPETASKYAYQLYYVSGAFEYNTINIGVGDRVEVELADRPDSYETFPRGTVLRGVLRQVGRPPKPDLAGLDSDAKKDLTAQWREQWMYVVEVKPRREGQVRWNREGDLRAFRKTAPKAGTTYQFQRTADIVEPQAEPANAEGASGTSATPNADRFRHLSEVTFNGEVEPMMFVLPDFDTTVGMSTPDELTFVVTLKNRTPFFLDLVAFYPLYPVNRRCIEKYGTPDWTKSENIVCNGPFLLEYRRIRDRVRLVKNPRYWNSRVVKLGVIDALTVPSETTGLNMYLNDQCDWATTVPSALIPELRKRDDFYSAPMLTTYFYRLNVKRPPLDDVHFRRALNMAIDKQLICDKIARGGQQAARSFVPPGLPGYSAQLCGPFDPKLAKEELAKSKYAGQGKLPKIEILYNSQGGHRDIAEVIQQQWKNNLGIDIGLVQMEWGTYLNTVHQMQYDVARAGWIGDYPDPNTFLDMWVTGGDNNETGWSNSQYDKLIAQAAAETDSEQRMRLFERAEQILMNEQPIIPIYFYVSINMVQPDVKGFFNNIQDIHPLHLLRAEPRTK